MTRQRLLATPGRSRHPLLGGPGGGHRRGHGLGSPSVLGRAQRLLAQTPIPDRDQHTLAALTKPLFLLAGAAGLLLAARFIDGIGKGIRTAPRDALIADVGRCPTSAGRRTPVGFETSSPDGQSWPDADDRRGIVRLGLSRIAVRSPAEGTVIFLGQDLRCSRRLPERVPGSLKPRIGTCKRRHTRHPPTTIPHAGS